MRIIHLLLGRCNPDSANGVDKSVYNLAKNQAKLGLNVAILSLTDKTPILIPSVEILTPRFIAWGRLGAKLPFANHKVESDILAWKPDLVHFHSVHIGPFIGIAKVLRRRGIPYVVTPHGGLAPGRLAQVGLGVRTFINFLEKPYLNGAKFVHAVSRNDAEGLRMLGVHTQSVVIPNGIDLATIPIQMDLTLLRRRYPVLGDKRIFLFLGRLDTAHKGLDLLLEAFAFAALPEARLVLAGPDWRGSLSHLQEQTTQLRLADRVVFTGPIYGEEKWAYLAGADIFLHPSRWEGSSFSVLEALAMGKPVLVSQAADPGELGTLKAGLIVEPNMKALTSALRDFAMTDQEDLVQMGEQAKKIVNEHYCWRNIAQNIMEAYGRAL